MSGFRIDQILAGFADGDAISHDALLKRNLLRGWGLASDIFAPAEHTSPSMQAESRPLESYRATARDVVIHHYSIASAAVDAFTQSPARKVLLYHNITPETFFRGFNDRVAGQLAEARRMLPETGRQADAVWAVSRFNADELEAMGLAPVRVLPLVFDRAHLDVPDDPQVLAKFATRLTTILFVGRMAPNKKIETLLETFYWYHRTINRFSRLVIIGSDRSCPRYAEMLRMMAGDFDLANVCFEGFASPGGLPTYYRQADVFLTTSDHEGFCLPLLEAMHMNVPVVAHGIGGMPEALDGAGVLYRDLDPAQLAGLLHRVISDPAVRGEILASQTARMARERSRDIKREFAERLREVDPSLALG